jgi:RNA polymerase-binding transcription factor DksA
MTDVEGRKAELEARLAALQADVETIEDQLEAPAANESAEDQAKEREDDEVLEDLGAARVREIRMIDAALQRIEDGSYGTCTNCGNPIEPKRLDLLPETPLCATCAATR